MKLIDSIQFLAFPNAKLPTILSREHGRHDKWMHIFDDFSFFFVVSAHNHMTRDHVPEHVLSNDVKVMTTSFLVLLMLAIWILVCGAVRVGKP